MKNQTNIISSIIFTTCFFMSCSNLTELSAADGDDNQNLINMRVDINKIASEVSCTNADEWIIKHYGGKLHNRYVVCHSKTDSTALLKKIKEYNKAEEESYNKNPNTLEYAVRKPKGIKCENRKAVFTYPD